MTKVPNVEDIKNCNCALVYLSNTTDKPVQVQIMGTFEQVTNDGEDLIIKTNSQYGVFKSSEVSAIHFYKR